MRVEKIEKSKHKQERILVYLEGGDLLRITEEELLHFGLYQGLDITPETVVELKKSGERSETRVKAVNMISARPLSRSELKRRLVRGGAEETDAESAAEYLERLGAVDDAAYAAMLVRHYSARGYGEARLRDELYRRGVPRELWDDALASAPPAEETLLRLLEHKASDGLTGKEYKRLVDGLLRRGFRRSEVVSAMHTLGVKIENEED